MYIYIFIIISFICKTQNLIINGSFENHSGINCSNGTFSVVDNWSGLASPDYFNSICSGPVGVPYNGFGAAYPVHGTSYIGIIGYHIQAEYKEYVQQFLNTPLNSNSIYYLSFYISKSDRTVFSIKNVGAYFSVSPPAIISQYISAIPQIENQNGFLSDTIGWTKIEGYFKAQGGEQYITIGNFNSNASTDTLRSGATNPIPFEPYDTYYYIDSVSLYDSLTYVTGINELKKETQFNLYPNPNNGLITISSNSDIKKIELSSVTGQILSSENINSKEHQLQLQNFAEGIYFLKVTYPNGLTITRKIIKQ